MRLGGRAGVAELADWSDCQWASLCRRQICGAQSLCRDTGLIASDIELSAKDIGHIASDSEPIASDIELTAGDIELIVKEPRVVHREATTSP